MKTMKKILVLVLFSMSLAQIPLLAEEKTRDGFLLRVQMGFASGDAKLEGKDEEYGGRRYRADIDSGGFPFIALQIGSSVNPKLGITLWCNGSEFKWYIKNKA